MESDSIPSASAAAGPLAGLRVVEVAGIGPAPFCCMLLADMGATVIRVDRVAPADVGVPADPKHQLLNRGRRSVAVDLKSAEGIEIVKKLIAEADVLVEGFRPGVMERLGLGPDDCLAQNPRLVYGRMTGWGQDGPLAQAAGHDLNYIALTGALDVIGPKDGPPVSPMNLIGDFGGGALYLAFGILCALREADRSSRGQVVDSAIVDGTAHLMTSAHGMVARNDWGRGRAKNLLNGGRPWYGVYRTADDQYVTLGAVEERFYREMLERTGLIEPGGVIATAGFDRADRATWPVLAEKLEAMVRTRTKREWTELLEGTDACFAPVLDIDEALEHPHMKARGVYVESHGVVQPAPAPRFSRSTPLLDLPPPRPGQHSREILLEQGYAAAQVDDLLARGVIV